MTLVIHQGMTNTGMVRISTVDLVVHLPEVAETSQPRGAEKTKGEIAMRDLHRYNLGLNQPYNQPYNQDWAWFHYGSMINLQFQQLGDARFAMPQGMAELQQWWLMRFRHLASLPLTLWQAVPTSTSGQTVLGSFMCDSTIKQPFLAITHHQLTIIQPIII